MSDFDISYNLNYGSMARGKQQVDPWVQPSLVHNWSSEEYPVFA